MIITGAEGVGLTSSIYASSFDGTDWVFPLLCLKITTESPDNPIVISQLFFEAYGNFSGDARYATVYYSGNSSEFANASEIGTKIYSPGTANQLEGFSQTLSVGENYFWVVVGLYPLGLGYPTALNHSYTGILDNFSGSFGSLNPTNGVGQTIYFDVTELTGFQSVEQTNRHTYPLDGAAILRFELTTSGSVPQPNFLTFTGTTDGTTDLNDITSIYVVHTGTNSVYNPISAIGFSDAVVATASFETSMTTDLQAGVNYFWLIYLLQENATEYNFLDGTIETVNEFTPVTTNYEGNSQIFIPTTIIDTKVSKIPALEEGGAYTHNGIDYTTTYPGSEDAPVIRIAVLSDDNLGLEVLSSFSIFNVSTAITTNCKVYFTGTSSIFSTEYQVGETAYNPSFDTISGNVEFQGAQGTDVNWFGTTYSNANINYFWITLSNEPGQDVNLVYLESFPLPIEFNSNVGGSYYYISYPDYEAGNVVNITGPNNLTASNISIWSVTFDWTAPGEWNGTYSVYLCEPGPFFPTHIASGLEYRITGLTPGTTYFWTITLPDSNLNNVPIYSFTTPELPTISGTQTLLEGDNYFWVTYDISSSATLFNTVGSDLSSVVVDGTTYSLGFQPALMTLTSPFLTIIDYMTFSYMDVNISSVTGSYPGETDVQLFRIEVAVSGFDDALIPGTFSFVDASFDFGSLPNLLSPNVNIYYTGTDSNFNDSVLFGTTTNTTGTISVGNSGNIQFTGVGGQTISNYFWVTADVATAAYVCYNDITKSYLSIDTSTLQIEVLDSNSNLFGTYTSISAPTFSIPITGPFNLQSSVSGNKVNLSWEGPNGYNGPYQVIADQNNPPSQVITTINNTNYTKSGLSYSALYYWTVKIPGSNITGCDSYTFSTPKEVPSEPDFRLISSNLPNPLLFFNKEGDALNFQWSQTNERWEGDIIFHANSNDTFKTNILYTFERIPSFEFELPGTLKLDKFQLFNEFRFNITGNSYMTQSVSKIDIVNTDTGFYSKWIYGDNFEKKFPVGSQILFQTPIFEFTNPNQSYTVVSTKKGAILIISNVDNGTFNSNYGPLLGLTSSYTNVTISGLNSLGIYNYVDGNLNSTLSSWSEPDFYSKYYNGKKLTFINTAKNDGVWTVNNVDIFDKSYYKYQLDLSALTQSNDLLIELILKTDLPLVYTGSLNLIDNRVNFGGPAPIVFKPGVEFVINGSSFNTNALVVDSIPTFIGNSNLVFYATQSQVIWNNLVYQCIQAYTWSATSSINPSSASYWTPATFIPVTTQLTNEVISSTEIQLTTNKIYYQQAFTQSSEITFALAAEKYYSDLKFFNIDLYYENSKLHADLVYPSLYAEVNFYQNSISMTSSGYKVLIYEQNVGILETLTPEINEDVNLNFNYNIVFTDLDEYGLKIIINGQEYVQEIDFVYIGLNVNLPRTIDKTLRNWLVNWYAKLNAIGIIPTLQYTGSQYSIYYNTINLKTEYPNVPLQFKVLVGSTADFYIEHTDIIFNDSGGYLNIKINSQEYGVPVTLPTSPTASNSINISTALATWVDTYSDTLIDYGIYVSSVHSLLQFRVKEQNQRLDILIATGKSSLPGINQYVINKKLRGSFGALVTSNEIILPDDSSVSFEKYPFATGQIVSINNTSRPFDNQEYNILFLNPHDLVLSYQGPFWGTTDPRCSVSGYVNIAFSGGFGATGCLPIITPPQVPGGGMFDQFQFSASFNLTYASTNTYSISTWTLGNNSNLVDIIYTQFNNSVYVLGSKLDVLDSRTMNPITTINLSGSSNPIKLVFNSFNSYLYILSQNLLTIVDPVINYVLTSITLPYNAGDILVNNLNGDVYVSYANTGRVDIWDSSNFGSTETAQVSTSGNPLKMAFNEDEMDIYVTADDSYVTRIDGTSRAIVATYYILGLKSTIYYEPINSTIWVFGFTNLVSINNAIVTQSLSVPSSTFNEIILNNHVGELVISQSDLAGNDVYSRNDLSGNAISTLPMATNSYGSLSIGQYDGDVYLCDTTGKVRIIDSLNGNIKSTQFFNSNIVKLVFNLDRNSMIGIRSATNEVVEIGVTINSTINLLTPTYSIPEDNQYGTLHPEYTPHPDLWLKTREYIRKPRENYNDEPLVKYVWKWETDQTPQMFLYDFSGEQLPITGSYAYVGSKPLELVSLNRNPNKNLEAVSLPEFQQTIFSEIVQALEHVDSTLDLSIIPEPLQTFVGFRSDDEGPISSRLILYKREDITFTITTSSINSDIIQFRYVVDSQNGDYGIIAINLNSATIFTFDSFNVTRGLKAGQHLKIYVTDNTNTKNRYTSFNNGKVFKIRNVYTRYIVVDFLNEVIVDEFTQIDDYPKSGKTTYLTTKFKIVDKEIGRFNVYGQTEIEDIRYKIELSNVGQNVAPEDSYIFKEYDINEQGIDWTYLNRKRKEMMMVRHDIYPYVGSYKAIINAINYFGYNDLELYEYYRNINVNSPDFFKLFKVEIPDIFDNTVEGWTVNDFIKHTMPNPNFETTNLFNLTYRITDKEGNNVQVYSIAEVIIKLQGLKWWLQKNIIPITHKILDITGRADFVGDDTITHRSYDAKILNIKQDMTPIDFNLTEAYLMPVNSGSPVYTCHVDFTAATSSYLPDYFNIKVRTYKTYKEWAPFITYEVGDEVSYYGKIYQSVIASNRIKNPRKYEAAAKWNTTTDYQLGQIVNYNRYIYEYVGTQSSFIIFGSSSVASPYYDIINNASFAKWVDITEWKELDFVPVQTISEYRTGTHSFNFTVDSNLDPFVTIEVTSDNGYGQAYTSKKNYEIRGLKDLAEPIKYIDPIGPFQPIIQLGGSVL